MTNRNISTLVVLLGLLLVGACSNLTPNQMIPVEDRLGYPAGN
jgi:hypothetical protein